MVENPADPIISMQEEEPPASPRKPIAEATASAGSNDEVPLQTQAAAGTDERFIQDIRALDETNTPAVVMMGLSGAGKTWLLHRFLEVVSKHEDSRPKFKSVPHGNGDGVDLGATTSFDFYTIFADPWYRLIDTPGEQTRLLTAGEDVNVSELWQLTAALKRASALIIALPCDIAVLGPMFVDEVDIDQLYKLEHRPLPAKIAKADVEKFIVEVLDDLQKLENFTTGLFQAAATLSYVRHHEIDCLDRAQFAREVTDERVMAHLGKRTEFQPVGGKYGLNCPSYFALTKWDRLLAAMYADGEGSNLEPVEAQRLKAMWELPEIKIMAAMLEYRGLHTDGALDLERPADLLNKVNGKLHHRLLKYFPMGRFDFVSAFFGHLGSDKLKSGHYRNHPDHGVEEIREWIKDARTIATKGEVKFGTYAAAREMHFFLRGISMSGGGIGPGRDQ